MTFPMEVLFTNRPPSLVLRRREKKSCATCRHENVLISKSLETPEIEASRSGVE